MVLRRVGQAVDVPGVVLCPVQGREKTFKVLISGDELTSSKVTKMEEEELTLDPRSYLGVQMHKVCCFGFVFSVGIVDGVCFVELFYCTFLYLPKVRLRQVFTTRSWLFH